MLGLDQLLVDCAPQVAPDTMAAIVRVESGGNPLAMNVNGEQRLARQPTNKMEAVGWATWLIAHGYSVDMGLAQVNSRNLQRLGVSADQLFEPCANLKAGARILTENYLGAKKRFGAGQDALRAAISAYNTGNYHGGFANGYVAKVDASAGISPLGISPPLVDARRMKPARQISDPNGDSRGEHGLSHDSRVFVFGRGGDYQNLPRAAGEPAVTWVKR